MLALYHNDMSLCAQKVRVCLAEKGLRGRTATSCCARRSISRPGTEAQPPRRGSDPDRRRQGHSGIERDPRISRGNLSGAARSRRRTPLAAPRCGFGPSSSTRTSTTPSAAIISFGIAFRHQYLERGELGNAMLEQIPNIFKRERRRDVIENGPDSQHFVIAVERMVLLLDEMEEALAAHRWLAGDEYSSPTSRSRPICSARASRPSGHGRRAPARRRLVPPLQGAAELHEAIANGRTPNISP